MDNEETMELKLNHLQLVLKIGIPITQETEHLMDECFIEILKAWTFSQLRKIEMWKVKNIE